MDKKLKKDKNNNPESVSSRERKLLDLIGKYESSGGDYNILYSGYKGKTDKKITEMTVDEVLKLQNKMKSSGSSAVGAHQIINKTLLDEIKKQKINKSQKFTPELQDSIILNRLKRIRGYDKFIKGDIDAKQFGKNLSKEFASMPNPETGKSYYDGDGLNKSLIDTSEYITQLEQIKNETIKPVEPELEEVQKRSIMSNTGQMPIRNFKIESTNTRQPSFKSESFNVPQYKLPNLETSEEQTQEQIQKPQQQATPTQAQFLEQYLHNNQFAKGGNLNISNMQDTNPNNFLTEFNTGGTHEQNPLGGIPQGIGANGKMNTVEEGETKAGDYVFSDRLTLDETIIKKHGLPKSFKGKTMAEASKQINKHFKESDNKIDKDTTKEMLERLTNASEDVRLANEILTQGSLTNQAFNGGKQESMGEGFGNLNSIMGFSSGIGDMLNQTSGVNNGNATVSTLGNTVEKLGANDPSGIVSGVGSTVGFANDIFGDTNIDTSGVTRGPNVKVGAKAVGNALKGASTGAKIGGPWGAVIGGVVGGAAGIIGGNKAKKDAAIANHNNTLLQNQSYNQSDFAMGGNMNMYNNSGFLTGDDPTDPFGIMGMLQGNSTGNVNDRLTSQQQYNKPNVATPGYGDSINKSNFIPGFGGMQKNPQDVAQSAQDANKKQDEDSGFNLGNLLRYAPAATNAYQLFNMDDPEQIRLDRLHNKLDLGRVDEARMERNINSSFNNNYVKEGSAGNLGSYLANSAMMQLNKARAISDGYAQADNTNAQRRGQEQQFDLSVGSTNLQQSNLEQQINAKSRAAYDNNKSKFISALGEDIGNIGLEEMRKKYPERLDMLYDYLGKYRNNREA